MTAPKPETKSNSRCYKSVKSMTSWAFVLKDILIFHLSFCTMASKGFQAVKTFRFTNTMSSNLKTLVLRGQIAQMGDAFMATVEKLPLFSRGDSPLEAENRLVRDFRNWVQACEEKGSLERELEDVGYSGIDDETEIHLIFSDDEEGEL